MSVFGDLNDNYSVASTCCTCLGMQSYNAAQMYWKEMPSNNLKSVFYQVRRRMKAARIEMEQLALCCTSINLTRSRDSTVNEARTRAKNDLNSGTFRQVRSRLFLFYSVIFLLDIIFFFSMFLPSNHHWTVWAASHRVPLHAVWKEVQIARFP